MRDTQHAIGTVQMVIHQDDSSRAVLDGISGHIRAYDNRLNRLSKFLVCQ